MVQIEDNFEFKKRVTDMDLVLPESIAILPQNFFSDGDDLIPFYNEEVKTVKKLFKEVEIDNIECKTGVGSVEFKAQKSGELVLPSLLISSILLTQNPEIASIAINVISNYVYDMFKGVPKKKQMVKMDIISEVKKSKQYTRIKFEGEPDSLKDLPRIIKEIHNK